MDDNRFEHLMSGLLDEELSVDELSELSRLAREHSDRQAVLQSQLEAAGLIAQAEDELRDSPLFVAATLDRIHEDPFVTGVRAAIAVGGDGRSESPPRRNVRWPWVVAAAAVLALFAVVAVCALEQRTGADPDHCIERIDAMDGRRRAGKS